jgi:hypothetical protein
MAMPSGEKRFGQEAKKAALFRAGLDTCILRQTRRKEKR